MKDINENLNTYVICILQKLTFTLQKWPSKTCVGTDGFIIYAPSTPKKDRKKEQRRGEREEKEDNLSSCHSVK